jgi:hypothetical protein
MRIRNNNYKLNLSRVGGLISSFEIAAYWCAGRGVMRGGESLGKKDMAKTRRRAERQELRISRLG